MSLHRKCSTITRKSGLLISVKKVRHSAANTVRITAITLQKLNIYHIVKSMYCRFYLVEEHTHRDRHLNC